MPDNEESAWDQISSLDLAMDEDYSAKAKEDRRHSRADISALKKVLSNDISSLPIKVASADYGVLDGSITDISESGCRIVVPNKLRKGEPTKVGFIIEKRKVITNAIVRWASPTNDGCMAGLEFQGMSSDLKEFISAICKASKFNSGGEVRWG